jgi:hypothetical protein
VELGVRIDAQPGSSAAKKQTINVARATVMFVKE